MHTGAVPLICMAISLAACGAKPAEPLSTPPPAATTDATTEVASAASTDAAASAAPSADPSVAAPEPEPEPEPVAPPAPPQVEASKPTFVGDGEVPKVEAFVDKMRAGTAACVAEHGGLSGDVGEMKVQFLVRLRGKAEGVDVLSSKGVSEDAQRCVRVLFKGKRVGTPSNDPVGVQFRYRFKKGPTPD